MTFEERKIRAHEIVSAMTNKEKAFFLQGKDFWRVNGNEKYSVPVSFLSDGPLGLRKQPLVSDHMGLLKSEPAVCYPASATAACSFDEKLLEEFGASIASEAIRQKIDMILCPGMNHQRNPLCGRNFEYYSEDPLLTGVLASAVVRGIKSQKVACCVKHFAANSQETLRLVSDSVVDERALFELYLRAFEYVVRNAEPDAIMTAYNKVNGTYSSENKFLMEDVARKKWGYRGLFLTDWGALNDEVNSFASGLDLEMPGVCKGTDEIVLDAVEKKLIPQERLDDAAENVITFSLLHSEEKTPSYTEEESLALSLKIAEESAVLLKNQDKLLPASKEKNIAVIGRFAKHPRYQGAGSSKVNPVKVVSALDAFDERGINYKYAKGYHEEGWTSRKLLKEAVNLAKGKDLVFIFAGLPPASESEGSDRNTLSMPKGIGLLIDRLCHTNENCVLVLHSGSPVHIPCYNKLKAVMYVGLGGGMSGEAAVKLLMGEVNPSGCLAQSWPKKIEDIPSYPWYLKNRRVCEYRESIFSGYRYYDAGGVEPLYRFGHGLSYTSFSINSLSSTKTSLKENEELELKLKVKNTGSLSGASVVCAYVSNENPLVVSYKKELAAFKKVFLKPQEECMLSLTIPYSAFSYYNRSAHDFAVQGGLYSLSVEAMTDSVKRESQSLSVNVERSRNFIDESDFYKNQSAYGNAKNIQNVTREDFEKLLGRKVPENPKIGKPFNQNTTLQDLVKSTLLFKFAKPIILHMAGKYDEGSKQEKKNTSHFTLQMPIRGIGMMGGMTKKSIARLIKTLNRWLF